MDIFSNSVVKFRGLILTLTIVFTGFFAYQLQFLKVDSNIVDALPKTDSIVQVFKEVGNRFGSNEIGLIIIESENVFMPDALEHIRQISDSITGLDGVVGVTV